MRERANAACGLLDYGVRIQEDLERAARARSDPGGTAGYARESAALAAIDSLDATRAEGEDALNAASEDVGPVIERAFEAALEATGIACDEPAGRPSSRAIPPP